MTEHNGVATVRIDRLDSMDDRVLRAGWPTGRLHLNVPASGKRNG